MSKPDNITPPSKREAGTKTLRKPLIRPTPDRRAMDIQQYSAHSILVRAVAAGVLAAGALLLAFRVADAQSAPGTFTSAVHAPELTRASEFIVHAQAIKSRRAD